MDVRFALPCKEYHTQSNIALCTSGTCIHVCPSTGEFWNYFILIEQISIAFFQISKWYWPVALTMLHIFNKLLQC